MVPLNSFLSIANSVLRRCATILPNRNPVRLAISNAWTRLLTGLSASVEIKLGNRPMRILPRFRNLSSEYEAETLSVWLKLVRPEDVVWDIGANIGVYTILSGQAVGKQGAVECWEPTPESYASTCKHLEINGLTSNCNVHQAAISEQDGGTMPFSIVGNEGTDPTNRLGSTHGKTIEVPIQSIDAILARSDRKPNYLKIDIEGAEVFALRGAENLMTEPSRPVILLAVHPMFLPEFDCDVKEIAEIVSQRGYLAFDMRGRICNPVEYSEYLLVPSEQVAAVVETLDWMAVES